MVKLDRSPSCHPMPPRKKRSRYTQGINLKFRAEPPEGTSHLDKTRKTSQPEVCTWTVDGAIVQEKAERQKAFAWFAQESFARWTSDDLVNHAFGHIISISLVAKIILVFLHCRLIVVQVGEKEVPSREWPEACAQAAACAHFNAHPSTTDTLARKKTFADFLKLPYTWTWTAQSASTESDAENFLNTISIAAYLAAGWVAPDDLEGRMPAVRFTTLPRPGHALPLASSTIGQDSRPDFFAMFLDAFVSKDQRQPGRFEEYVRKPSVQDFIKKCSPSLWAQYTEVSNSVMRDTDSIPHQVLPELNISYVERDILTKERLREEASSGTDVNDDIKSIEDLIEMLQALHKKLENGTLPSPPPWVKDAVNKHLGNDFLDLSRICFPNIITPGEGKQTDARQAVYHCLGYMCQQRRAQSWLSFSMGLIVTKDKFGILRADATGIEECIFEKASSRGVVDVIRVALGITLATEQERGVHPSFSFREKETSVETDAKCSAPLGEESVEQMAHVSKSGSLPPTKPPAREPKTFRHREVDIITLPNNKLHPEASANGETRFYAKTLIENRGSLIGRCTRVWCVYAEVLADEKIKVVQKYNIPTTAPIFSGPYALKLYCADVLSEAYKDDILSKVIKANPRHVLLPTKMWHLGQVSDVVRGLEVGALPPKIKPSDFKDRQEIVTVSPLKRTLGQFATAEEFYEALIGTVKAIEALAAIGIIHRDVSMGNIVLNCEDYDPLESEIVSTRTSLGHVFLVRRAPVHIGLGGGLHDLDMAAFIPKQKSVEELTLTWEAALDYMNGKTTSTPWSARKALREVPEDPRLEACVGTTPFMSTRLLLGKQHSVYDDLQSTFFVHYLSLFSYDTPGPHRYLGQLDSSIPLWPHACMMWAHRGNESMANVGRIKKGFFQEKSPQPWQEIARLHCREFWMSPDSPGVTGTLLDVPHWVPLMEFHSALWEINEGHEDLNAKVTAKPCDVISALENALRIYRTHSS